MPLVIGSPAAPRMAGTPKYSSQSAQGEGGSGFCLKPATCSTFLRKGDIAQLAEDAHRGHAEGAAAIQVVLDHDLLLGAERVVRGCRVGKAVLIHAVVDDVIDHPPDDHREGLQVGELGRAALGDFPMREAEAGGGQGIGVGAVGNGGGTSDRIVGIDQQDRRRGNADEAEIGAGVVVGGGVSGGVRRDDIEVIGLAGNRAWSGGPNGWW